MVGTHGGNSPAVTTGARRDRRNRFPRASPSTVVPFPRPIVDIHRPPEGFDALVDWFELVSYNLVLLEDYPLEEVRSAVATVVRAIETHLRTTTRIALSSPEGTRELADRARILVADHEWFRTSVEQLWWFLGVVEREDHGGHRQALGQYGRVLCESVRRHRAEEDEFVRRLTGRHLSDTIAPPPGNPK
jgi:hypothetical protein